jgi:hypothetical protein
MKAAAQIESWLQGRHPDFMARSTAWYVEFYARKAHEDPGDVQEPLPLDASVPALLPDALPAAAPAPSASASAASREAAASISVVIPVFNHARHLGKCIRSAHEQTLPPGEIVCVDDGSTDPAVRPLLEGLAREIPELRLERSRRTGYRQRPEPGRGEARGEFVAFLTRRPPPGCHRGPGERGGPAPGCRLLHRPLRGGRRRQALRHAVWRLPQPP